MGTKGRALFRNVTTKALGLSSGQIADESVRYMNLENLVAGNYDGNRFVNLREVSWTPAHPHSVLRGEYIESPAFSIQGIHDIRLRFYPAGKVTSKQGYCALYAACKSTDRDVQLRLKVGNKSHILKQRMDAHYVDGFVNFCVAEDAMVDGMFSLGMEIILGPKDAASS